jgi:nitroreductase
MSNTITQFLQQRRSVVAKKMLNDAPSSSDLETILNCGLRVPDHSNVQPWQIVVISGDMRRKFGEQVVVPAAKRRAAAENQPFSDVIEQMESARFERAGCVLAVLCTPTVPHKIPLWEQQLTSAAVCMQLLNAAQALDYAAQWITEWLAYDADIIRALNGDPQRDQIAGFIYIGAKQEQPAERARPEPASKISYLQL